MENLRLPAPPLKYEQRDESENRRLIELAFSRPTPAASGGLSSRRSVELVTLPLANLAAQTGSVDMGAPGQVLYGITADRACRVRLYATDDARLEDALRAESEDPPAGTGVFIEAIWLDTHTKIISPPVVLFNFDSPATNAIYYVVENRSGALAAVTVTFVVLSIEA